MKDSYNFISPIFIKDSLEGLTNKGVKIPKNLLENLERRSHWWSLNTAVSIIDIISQKIAFRDIEFEPNVKNGDVDLKFMYGQMPYLIQIKSPDFFNTKVAEKLTPRQLS